MRGSNERRVKGADSSSKVGTFFEPMPIGLKLKKTPSQVDILQKELSELSSYATAAGPQWVPATAAAAAQQQHAAHYPAGMQQHQQQQQLVSPTLADTATTRREATGRGGGRKAAASAAALGHQVPVSAVGVPAHYAALMDPHAPLMPRQRRGLQTSIDGLVGGWKGPAGGVGMGMGMQQQQHGPGQPPPSAFPQQVPTIGLSAAEKLKLKSVTGKGQGVGGWHVGVMAGAGAGALSSGAGSSKGSRGSARSSATRLSLPGAGASVSVSASVSAAVAGTSSSAYSSEHRLQGASSGGVTSASGRGKGSHLSGESQRRGGQGGSSSHAQGQRAPGRGGPSLHQHQHPYLTTLAAAMAPASGGDPVPAVVAASAPSSSSPAAAAAAAPSSPSVSQGRIKASNFPASTLQIGTWKKVARHEGELIAKCYYAKKKLVWEILENGVKKKIEINWADITGLNYSTPRNRSAYLEIELARPPVFCVESDPQPRRHTMWHKCQDFTLDAQASRCKPHRLFFAPGVLNKHIDRLFKCDARLAQIYKQNL